MRAGVLALGAFSIPFLAATARAGVLVVDASGGGHFTDLPPAVAAAHDGDTILVRAGSYSGFTISNRELTVVADAGGVVVSGQVRVLGLTASRTVVLAGLQITGSVNDVPRSGLVLSQNEGPVRAHGCSFTGPDRPSSDRSSPGAGALIHDNLAGVAFAGCTFRGGSGGYCFGCGPVTGGTGLEIRASLVALYDCDVRGGDGIHGELLFGGDGGTGARLVTAPQTTPFLHASSSTIRGGDGGDACEVSSVVGGDAGNGLVLESYSTAWTIGTQLLAGEPGVPGPFGICTGTAGQPGVPLSGNGAYFLLGLPPVEMIAPALVREGSDWTLTVRGQPGVDVFLFVSGETEFVGIPSWRGVRVTAPTGPPQLVRILGSIPGSGEIVERIAIPALPAGVRAQRTFVQVWSRGPIDGRVLGSFCPLTVIDSAY